MYLNLLAKLNNDETFRKQIREPQLRSNFWYENPKGKQTCFLTVHADNRSGHANWHMSLMAARLHWKKFAGKMQRCGRLSNVMAPGQRCQSRNRPSDNSVIIDA